MKSYPIHIRREYRGGKYLSDTQEYNRISDKVQDYLNNDLAEQEDDTIHVYRGAKIALDLGENSELVHEIIFSIDGGHNGVTIIKGDYERGVG